MMHLSEEDLILLYYGEPTEHPDVRSHLAECAECRSAAGSLARTLSVCNEWNVPERSAEFGRDVWLRLVPELEIQPKPKRGLQWLMGMQAARIGVAALAFAVLLVAVFLAGRFSRTPATPVMTGLSDQARDRILAIAVADHLDRVQMLMTEISNTRDSGPGHTSEISFKDERDRAEDLLQEGRLMRQTLARKGETATTSFLDEVERFLTEAAHTPDSVNADELRDLRGRIESGSLLFKVRIVESNLRNEEQRL
jgi:hypothetical protein